MKTLLTPKEAQEDRQLKGTHTLEGIHFDWVGEPRGLEKQVIIDWFSKDDYMCLQAALLQLGLWDYIHPFYYDDGKLKIMTYEENNSERKQNSLD